MIGLDLLLFSKILKKNAVPKNILIFMGIFQPFLLILC